MKLRIGRKRNESSLRPLTEKEIQRKLYGAYREENEGGLKEERGSILTPPGRKDKNAAFRPRKKLSFSFPWRKMVAILSKGFGGVLRFSRNLLSKTATGWGLGLLVVALLFLGIHGLNVYRVKAMKAPRPSYEVRPARLLRNPSRETPAVEKPEARPIEEAPIVEPMKPYVIQVCTYAGQADAERLTEQMKATGLPAFLAPQGRTGGKTFYPVFLGRFETFQEAQTRLKQFRQKPISKDFPDSFIRTL